MHHHPCESSQSKLFSDSGFVKNSIDSNDVTDSRSRKSSSSWSAWPGALAWLMALLFLVCLSAAAVRSRESSSVTVVSIPSWIAEQYFQPYSHQQPAASVIDLIESWGYPAEEHKVVTEDGYILTLHRIPPINQYNGDNTTANGVPVFLGHCLIGNSAIFAFGPPSNSLAYILSDAGYDVWMPNVRGNTHSRAHINMKASDKEFWDFGLEEGALMDYTAAADYISSKTGHSSMHFAGYSMGTTQLLMLLTMRPEYNDRFRSAHLMGPVAQAGNASNPMTALSDAAEAVQSSLDMVGIREILPNFGAAQKATASSLCPVAPELCRAFFAAFLVMRPEELGGDPGVVANFLTHMPSGASIGQMVHYAQLFRNGGKFTRFDYGRVSNLRRYGAPDPPEYDLARVRVPTSLYVGAADNLGSPEDAQELARHLSNAGSLAEHRLVGGPNWGHLHFGFSSQAGTVVNADIAKSMAATDAYLFLSQQQR